MNICEILFGKIWMHDVNAIHLKKNRLYKLRKGRVNYILTFLEKKSQLKTFKVEGSTFFTLTNFKEKPKEKPKKPNVIYVRR